MNDPQPVRDLNHDGPNPAEHAARAINQSLGFWEVADVARNLGHTSQAVSNAVLSVDLAAHALCVRGLCAGECLNSPGEVIRALRRLCHGAARDEDYRTRMTQYVRIVRHRHAAQSEGRSLSFETMEGVVKESRRFLDWVESILLTAEPEA